MKKIVILTALLSLLCIGPKTTQAAYVPIDDRGCVPSGLVDVDLSGYVVYEGYVFSSYCVVEGADPATFKAVKIGNRSYGYGRDKNNLYFGIKKLEGIDPDDYSYKILEYSVHDDIYDSLFVYDDDTIYMDGLPVSDLDLDSSEILNSNWLKDKNHVYQIKEKEGMYRFENKYYVEILEGADPAHFYFGYEITDDAVYWYGKKIMEADAKSFELFHLGYAKDKDNVFYEGKIQYGVDTKSFAELGGNFIDKNAEYDDGKTFQDIKDFKQQYIDNNKSTKIVNEPIKESLLEYKEKYPGYTPQPAIDPDNPPKHPTLDRIWDIITDYKYLNPPVYYAILIGPFVVLFSVISFVIRRKKK